MKAKYKTIEVKYIKFTNTPENIQELEDFFGDQSYDINNDDPDEPELTIDDFTEAYLNDYIVFENDEFNVYGEVEFNEMFDKID
jgi:cytochrome oxidase Cu insertion factor (SCO1/SenC/PrrC family)